MAGKVVIYTDGSCHTQKLTGAWASIIIYEGKKTIITGVEENTTHQRMELTAVMEGFKFVERESLVSPVEVYSDSQYVVELPRRRDKLISTAYITKAGKKIVNSDLLEIFFRKLQNLDVKFIKVKAHQQNGDPLNEEADQLVRELVRKNK
jgi:ribonuclease HI